jgi:hypothetical protein
MTVWSDEGKSTPAANPVVADDSGRVSFWGDGNYRIIVKSSDDVTTILDKDAWVISSAYLSPKDWDDDADDFDLTEALNHGASIPSPVSIAIGHVFCEIVDGQLRGIHVNHDGDEYFQALSFDEDGNQSFDDPITKYPAADIRHPDFSGGATGGADDSVPIQAAIDFLGTQSGGVLSIPPGTWKGKNLDLVDDIQVIGFGHSSKLSFPDAGVTTDDYIMKGDDLTNVDIRDVWFDGNGTNEATSILVALFNDTGNHSHTTIKGCHFENQGAGVALKIYGDADDSISVSDVNSACHFHDVHDGIYVLYADKVKIIGNNFTGLTGTPIKFEESILCKVADNTISDWETTVPGIHLDDTSHTEISGNILPATSGDPEAYGILCEENDGTSEFNDINHNDVTGGFTTVPIEVVSGTTIVWFNRGSTINQGGVSPDPAGGLAVSDFVYVIATGSTTSTETGLIADSGVTFPDVAEEEHDLIWVENEPYQLWYMDTPPTDSNEIVLKSSTLRLASATSFPISNTYKVYPNIRDDEGDGTGEVWELQATDNLAGSSDSGTFSIYSEVEATRIDIVGNSGTGAHTITQLDFDYEDEVATPLIATRIIADDSELTNHTNLITRFWLWRVSGISTLTINLSAGSGAAITVNVYHRRRDVDLVGSLA